MNLPGNQVGISDILNYRQCAQQFGFSMRRHTELPERFQLYPGEKDEPPEHESYASAYGHAVHDAIEIADNTFCTDDEAIEAIWHIYQHFLGPEDIKRMRDDLQTWRNRQYTGWRLVKTEIELRMPLFVHNGEMIYFRGRIDALYQHIDNPGVFMSRDYKSSRYPRTEAEIHADLQQWSYNALIHEAFPECEDLTQLYDQLRHGPPVPTRKNAQQRAEIKDWLVKQVKAILADNVLKPTRNDMCHFCPLMEDCRETHRSADWWINRLAVLAPEKKVGRKLVVQLTEEHTGFETYTDLLPRAKDAYKVLERFIKAVEAVLKEMPDERRDELGYDLTAGKRIDSFPPPALRAVRDLVGQEEFLHLVTITKGSVIEMFGEESEITKAILALAETKRAAGSIKRKRAA